MAIVDGLGEQTSRTVAGVATTAANFMPGMFIGTGIDAGAEVLNSELYKIDLTRAWAQEIFERLREKGVEVQRRDKDGNPILDKNGEPVYGLIRHDQEYSDLVEKGEDGKYHLKSGVIEHIIEPNREHLPVPLQEELDRADNISGKVTKFGAELGVQAAAGFLFPGGLIMSGAAGIGAGMLLQKPIDSLFGEEKKLTVTMVAPAMKHLAQKHREHMGESDTTVPIDKSLVGAYLIATHPEIFDDINHDEIVDMFQEHVQAKEKDPHAYTKLDKYMDDELDNLNDPNTPSVFNDYLVEMVKRTDGPKWRAKGMSEEEIEQQAIQRTAQLVGSKSALTAIADTVNGPKDLGNILFKPEKFTQKMELAASGALDAGNRIKDAMNQPTQESGVSSVAPVPPHLAGRDFSRN